MTVSRRERTKIWRIRFRRKFPGRAGARIGSGRFASSGNWLSAGDLGEIRDLIGGGADAGKQRQTVGAHRLVLIIHENAFKE